MKPTYIYIALVIIVIAGIVSLRLANPGGGAARATAYDGFAQCLSDAGATFYGAFWCPHCAEQKKLFDNSRALPYVECSTPDGNGRLQICVEKQINGYPTWIFADGEVVDRVMQLSELSEKTSCALPQV